MSTRDVQGQARPKDRVPPDEGYASHEVIEWEYPTRDNTPEVPPTDQLIDLADPALRRQSQDNMEMTRMNPSGQHRYSPYHVHSHSRRDSSSDQRSASPALSMVSNGTSSGSRSSVVQATLVENIRLAAPIRTKHRKQRLYTVDRRAICLMAKENPHLRQEDIAQQFNVERSTVSKILKEKDRWLATPEDPAVRISKYRLAKYPRLEAELKDWVVTESANGMIFTDAMIRKKAMELDEKWHLETEGKFKASPGWIENFKARVGIRKGRYTGVGTSDEKAKAQGIPADWNRWQQPPEPHIAAADPSPVGQSAPSEPAPAVPQPMEPSPEQTVWQQEQQPAQTWQQVQPVYDGSGAAISPSYDPNQVVVPVEPPPPYPEGSPENTTLATDYAPAGDGSQLQEYGGDQDDTGATQSQVHPLLAAWATLQPVLYDPAFHRFASINDEEFNVICKFPRALHDWVHGNAHRPL